nr:hypothetical protein [Brachyspira hampsonii]
MAEFKKFLNLEGIDYNDDINMENVSYKNIECLFTIKKLVNNKKADNRE